MAGVSCAARFAERQDRDFVLLLADMSIGIFGQHPGFHIVQCLVGVDRLNVRKPETAANGTQKVWSSAERGRRLGGPPRWTFD